MRKAPRAYPRVVIALIVSALLHALAFWVAERLIPRPFEQAMVRVQLLRPPRMVKRFPLSSGIPIPRTQMERLRTKEQPRGPPDVGMEFWQGPPVVEAPGPVGVEAMEERAEISARRPAIPLDVAPTLEELMWDSFLRRQAELEEYARIPLVTADTTDAESARRRRALQVVFEAIEAMGGKEALLTIQDMSYLGHYHKAYGPRSQYAGHLPGGARIVYDGVRGWIGIGGKAYPLQGQALREIVHRSER